MLTIHEGALSCLPGGSEFKVSACNAGDLGSIPGSDPWVGKIPWRRKWQPTPFLPRKPHGQRSLAVHGVAKNWYRRLYKVKWIKEAADKMSWQVSSTFKVQCLERKSRTWNYWVKLVLGDFTECWWEGVLVTNFISFDSLCFGLGLIYILSINIFFLLFQSLCTLLFNFYFFFFFLATPHVGSSSLTRDGTQAPSIAES